MDHDKEEKIKARAHQIWEEEGHPHGQHEAHWHRAAQEYYGMMGDGTEEQSLDQAGNPDARITEAEAKDAFAKAPKRK